MFESQTKQLRELVEAALPELETVIGWETGYDPLHCTPVFVKKPGDVSRLIWGPFCTQNLSGYLAKTPVVVPKEEGKKVGICVKGCDSRSVVALISEKFVEREKLYIIGLPCPGNVDWKKLMRLAPLRNVKSVEVQGNQVKVEDASGTHTFPLDQVLARKCLRCSRPNPVLYDVLVGEPIAPRVAPEKAYEDVADLEKKPIAERLAYWQGELDRCIRCYACRNACPLCVCQDRCIAETRDPKWLTQQMGTSEKFLFHFIHAMHLAGRCTECGECERACPMEIPVTLIKEKLNQITKELLGYEAGMDPEGVPPLLTFSPHETGL